MPVKKTSFSQIEDNLTKTIDVDDSAGRSVPVNMNFVEEGFIIKDTGFIPFGSTPDVEAHSIFNYKKKNGSSYLIRAKGTVLQQYSIADREWNDISNSPTFTAGEYFGYRVYNDELYLCNAVESMYKWNGSTFTAISAAPKGNILEIFEDRLFVSGVKAEPLTTYYSNVANFSTWTGTDVIKPLGTDHTTVLVNYYGTLLIFKQKTIWKLTFVYDQVVSLFVPKLEIQSGNYGACSKKAAVWVENDVWFFTGTEVRAIGYKDQQVGILGINNSVISENIKNTLKNISVENYSKVFSFYNNRRYHLAVPLNTTTNDTMFVCHTLYGNSWTKYTGRDKSRAGDGVVIDGVVYTANQSAPYGIIKWDVTTEDALTQNGYLITES